MSRSLQRFPRRLALTAASMLLLGLSACCDICEQRPTGPTVDEVLTLGRPVVLAHASGENVHPHSSPYGYGQTMTFVDVLDMDVQLTSDGVLVIHHDEDVDRTTEGTGLVAEMTFDQIHALDNAYWWTESCTCRGQPEDAYIWRGVRTGDKAPPEGYTPEDFAIARFSDIAARYDKVLLNIEVKGRHPDAVRTAQVLVDELRALNAVGRAVVTSFDDKVVDALRRYEPALELTPGLDVTTAWVLGSVPLPDGMRILQVPPEYEGLTVLTEELVKKSHDAGYVLWVWPNAREWENTEGYERLLDLGVDGINAADPLAAVQVLRDRGLTN